MAPYNFQHIEQKWQAYWKNQNTFAAEPPGRKPKCYVLDMFPYPSGKGLHVGHPLGYVASDIIARIKRLQGYNVLHPMGFDSFGLPAENYAIQTGQHPAVSTEQNVQRYNQQLEALGLAYDRKAELRTSDPDYYRWTQWIFLQLFNSWYDLALDRARPISDLVDQLQQTGAHGVQAAGTWEGMLSPAEWNALDKHEQEKILQHFRLAYLSYDLVNWCPALGTVLANEEVKDGLSERGGHPVERRPMRQWTLRITAYADRLLRDLDELEWSDALKEMQRNWIGRSEGVQLTFALKNRPETLEVFTTRPDTLFGVTYMALAPEHELVQELLPAHPEPEAARAALEQMKNRSERDRLMEAKATNGFDTGARAIHPLTGQELPIWVADYVLVGYGTGAIMAVPGHDSRDWRFASQQGLPIVPVVDGGNVQEAAHETKSGKLINSEFLNGLEVPDAIQRMLQELEARGLGTRQVNYRLRDAIFSRQRYWGEPFPIVFDGETPEALPEHELPVTLPEVDSYSPTGTGESPLAAVADWVNLPDGRRRETNTMPGWAGSSWYFLRFTDARNAEAFVSKTQADYWLPVDLYIGGAEHAVGHLLYSRFWTKVLFDLGHITLNEPFRKLVNQGMIQGKSLYAYKHKTENRLLGESELAEKEHAIPIHVDINLVAGRETDDRQLDVAGFRAWRPEYKDTAIPADLYLEEAVEKMSKSFYNVVTPDEICTQYGADTFRLYEMFLGPLEMHKPWSTNGINGVYNFLKKLYNHLHNAQDELQLENGDPTGAELKALHTLIKKVNEDTERLSFNTCVSAFMIALNELAKLDCCKRAIFEPFIVLLSPFAPHLCEEIWERMGHAPSISQAEWPRFNPEYLVEDSVEYPVQINGKMRGKLKVPANMARAEVEQAVLAAEEFHKYYTPDKVKKVVVVPGKIINVVAAG